MKKISLKVNILVSAALILLVGLSACNQPAGKSEGSSSASSASADMPIAYVNMDTLLFNYKMNDDFQEELMADKEKAEKQLMAREQQLKSEIMNYQSRRQGGLLSNNEIRATEEDLQMKQQQLAQDGQARSNGLQAKINLLNTKMFDSVIEYLEEYNKDGRYKFILSYSKGGGILLADKSLEITDEVLKGLNEKYKADKEAGKTTETSEEGEADKK